MLRKLIALGIVAGLTKKAWDTYHLNGTAKPTAANGSAPQRRKVKPAPAAPAARPEHKA